MPRKLRFTRIGSACCLIVLGSLGMAMFFEERLIYIPTKYPTGNWQPTGFEFEDAYFKSSDGVKLHGWYFEHANPEFYFLYCHGNADFVPNLGDEADFWRHYFQATFLIFDYRGYGRSEGSPTEAGVIRDARAARQWLAQRAGIDETKIILVGRSLGGGVAVALAAELPPQALVLQNSFSTLPNVAAVHFPYLPTRLLMRNRFDSLRSIQNYHGPVFQSHGSDDEVVPLRLAERLHAAIPGRKELRVYPGLTHNSREPQEYFADLREFLRADH